MTNQFSFRTRFAPSPSGIIHIGNLRSALMSFLCAKESNGSFILRIEDTDQARTQSCFVNMIYEILDIMQLYPDEGPGLLNNSLVDSYIQSERTDNYNTYKLIFLEKKLIYRCFQTPEKLLEVKNKQIALKQPPRHLRVLVSEEEESLFLEQKKPFVWRLKLPDSVTVINDKVKGKICYNLSNYSDYPITREDGSYTFLFANFVDDVLMKINYVIRGEEHLSNTAIQSYMYDALNLEKPLFYHLPLICDSEGKKLSKRNFGFNIYDLLAEGYLPEAIINYIAIIGSNFKQEIMSLNNMITQKVFFNTKSVGFITYDPAKLSWINIKWMEKISSDDFIKHLINYKKYNDNIIIPEDINLINDIKKESKNIKDFCINIKSIINNEFDIILEEEYQKYIIYLRNNIHCNDIIDINFIKKIVKLFALENNIVEKNLYNILRKILINKLEGISIGILLKYINRDILINKIDSIIFI